MNKGQIEKKLINLITNVHLGAGFASDEMDLHIKTTTEGIFNDIRQLLFAFSTRSIDQPLSDFNRDGYYRLIDDFLDKIIREDTEELYIIKDLSHGSWVNFNNQDTMYYTSKPWEATIFKSKKEALEFMSQYPSNLLDHHRVFKLDVDLTSVEWSDTPSSKKATDKSPPISFKDVKTLESTLNNILNEALITNKIKGTPTSNKISEFVSEYIKAI